MATTPMAAMHLSANSSPKNNKSSSTKKPNTTTQNLQHLLFTRRSATASALATAFVASEAFRNSNIATSFELSFTAPEQTVEEANAGIKGHVQDLLQIKEFIDLQSWREAQIALRESSAYVKQDLYTIIQAKPGKRRPQLRKLYSNLFNNVSRLDYAARSKDANVVKECYNNIVATLDEIFSII